MPWLWVLFIKAGNVVSWFKKWQTLKRVTLIDITNTCVCVFRQVIREKLCKKNLVVVGHVATSLRKNSRITILTFKMLIVSFHHLLALTHRPVLLCWLILSQSSDVVIYLQNKGVTASLWLNQTISFLGNLYISLVKTCCGEVLKHTHTRIHTHAHTHTHTHTHMRERESNIL